MHEPTGKEVRLARPWRALASWAVVAALVAAGCGTVPRARPPTVQVGFAEIGRTLIDEYGCGACHRIPGVPGANGLVGPPLDLFGRRSYIAGSLTNNQGNLVRWITDPQAIEAGTAMPDLGVSANEAQHMSAYLLSLN